LEGAGPELPDLDVIAEFLQRQLTGARIEQASAARALMTLITILCINFMADGLRDAIDPRLIL